MAPDAALQKRARETGRYAPALRELTRHLPEDDAALERALLQVVGDRDEDAFAHLLLAALHAGRPVDGRILEDGAALCRAPTTLVAAAIHGTGDVGGALLAAVRGGRLLPEIEAVALALVAWWSRERGCDVPAEAARLGRVLARHARSFVVTDMLLVLSDIAGDPGLAELLESEAWATSMARADFDRAIRECRDDPLAGIPEERPPTVLSGYTVRRAVPRVGRNDPCPCGSGKKYKRCCFERDRERLRKSSDVEGLTVEELRANPEPHLTRQRLVAMSPGEMARIDAARVEPELRGPLIMRMTWGHELDAVVRAFEATGAPPELDGHLLEAVEQAAQLGRRDVVKRLLALRGDRAEEDDDEAPLSLRARLAAAGLEPGPMLELIESSARESTDDELRPVDLAYALLGSDCPALGILVARGVLWTANPIDGWALLQELLETRDRLGLPPADPVEEPVERHWREEDHARDDEGTAAAVEQAGQQARQELDAKLGEVRRLRADLRGRDEALREMERKLEQLEASRDAREAGGHDPPAPTGAASGHDAPAAPDDEAAELVTELRRKLAERKAEVKRKHNERNALRAELARARKEVETLRVRSRDDAGHPAPNADAGADEDDEAALLIPGEATEAHPPRLPRFERPVGDDLRAVPAAVARAALRLLGRLAAGESAAFRGARRLSGHRDVWRQRVGMGHRLLFRTDDDTLVVLRLVTREDLARAIRSLP